MNIIWTLSLILSLILMIFTSPSLALESMLNATTKAVTLSIELIAIYTLWLGFLQLMEVTGLNKKLSKKLKPIIKFLFGNINEKASEQICINLSSNFLGMGNAATPSGINAMQHLSDGTNKITDAMTMLVVLNTSCLQLIPTTILGLRLTNGSTNASSIIIPTLLTGIITTILGVALAKLCFIFKRKQKV